MGDASWRCVGVMLGEALEPMGVSEVVARVAAGGGGDAGEDEVRGALQAMVDAGVAGVSGAAGGGEVWWAVGGGGAGGEEGKSATFFPGPAHQTPTFFPEPEPAHQTPTFSPEPEPAHQTPTESKAGAAGTRSPKRGRLFGRRRIAPFKPVGGGGVLRKRGGRGGSGRAKAVREGRGRVQAATREVSKLRLLGRIEGTGEMERLGELFAKWKDVAIEAIGELAAKARKPDGSVMTPGEVVAQLGVPAYLLRWDEDEGELV